MRKKYRFLSYHIFYCTLFVLVVSGLLALAARINIEAINPFKQAFRDFQITDLAFSRLKDPVDPGQDVVLVNIGNLDRAGIATQLNNISRFQPAVVGIDAFFKRELDSIGDHELATAMARTRNLVLVSKLDIPEGETEARGLIRSHPAFSVHAKTGFANFITGGEDGHLTTRRFTWKEHYNDSVEYSFAARILQLYKPGAFRVLSRRQQNPEVINYSGNLDKFLRLDVAQVLDSSADLSFLKGKIVLLGYLGEPMGTPSLTDIFYTPLNQNLAGRSVPDMYGITVHANILSQMIRNDYINHTPEWLDYVLGTIICIINVSIFLFLGRRFRNISQISMRMIQVAEVFILTNISLRALALSDLYFELSFTIALVLFTGDLAEIYQNAVYSRVEKLNDGKKRHKPARRGGYGKRRLFAK